MFLWNLCSISNRLSNEIRLFLEYMKPTSAEQAARDLVTQQTREFINQILPDHSTEVFGSQRTGLLLATSDIDIRLFEEGTEWTEGSKLNQAPRYRVRKTLLNALTQLWNQLNTHPDYILVHLRHARYPLISMQHKPSGYDIQIVCSNDTSNSRGVTQGYLREDPDIHAIFAVAKAMFDIRGLTDVYRGGIGSYTLLIMIIAALKFEELKTPTTLEGKFLAFINFYAKIDSYNNCYGVRSEDHAPVWPKMPLEKAIALEADSRKIGDLVSFCLFVCF
jgi:non-canonical poly(A) RNA polymerase PAPD5/7